MRNLSNGKSLELASGHIQERRSPQSSLSKACKTWDLAHLDLIVTSDTLEDDQKRKAIEHKKRRNGNVVMGAIVGGLIDGSDGDDSILDGVLLGAAFGAIATSGPGAATAKVGLLFSDNESLTVELDSNDYSQLQTIAEQNARRGQFPEGPSVKTISPTKNDMDCVLRDRAFDQLKKMLIFAVVIALGSSFASSLPSSGLSGASESQPMLAAISEIGKGLPYIGGLLGMIFLVAGFVAVSRPESQLRTDEKERYASLSPAFRKKLDAEMN